MLLRVALVRTDITAKVHSSPIFVTLMLAAIQTSTTLVLTRAPWRNIPEDGILQILVFLRSMLLLLITANIVPSSQILVTLMMEAIRSSETSVLTRNTRCNILEDGIQIPVFLHSML
jgi:hypothetical protein